MRKNTIIMIIAWSILALAYFVVVGLESEPLVGKLYEYNVNNDDSAIFVSAAYNSGQTFTIGTTGDNESFTLCKVALKMYKVGNPGTIRVGVRETNLLTPVDEELSFGEVNGDLISTEPTWYNIPMSPVVLYPGETYAITLESVTGSYPSNCVYFRMNTSMSWKESYEGGTYTYGYVGYGWWIEDLWDLQFEVWGYSYEEE